MGDRFNLILTDWSGVVSDDRGPVHRAVNLQHERYGLPPVTFDDFFSRVQANAPKWFAQLGVSDLPDEDTIIKDYAECFDEACAQGPGPFAYSDVKQTFRTLKAFEMPVVVISSHPAHRLEIEAEEYGIQDCITGFVGNAKDKTPHLDTMTRMFGVPKDYVLYIGDTTFDVLAGHRAGVRTGAMAGPIEKQRGYHTRAQLTNTDPRPHYVLESLLDITDTSVLRKRRL